MNVEHILARKGREVKTIGPTCRSLKRSAAYMPRGSDRRGLRERHGPAGILSDRDILDAIADHGIDVLGESIRGVMTKKVFTCSRDDRVSALMALMTDRRIRHIPVVEKDGRLCGMVSIGDVVKQRLDDIQSEADALREYVTSTM